MKIKKDDKVQIITGKDKGKSGKVLQVFPKEHKIAVEGLNLLVKNVRGKRHGEKGQQVQFPALINASNVQLLCPKCGKMTRISFKIMDKEDDKKIKLKNSKLRQCKKCQQLID